MCTLPELFKGVAPGVADIRVRAVNRLLNLCERRWD